MAVVLFDSAQSQRIMSYSFTVIGVIVAIAMIVFPEKRTFKSLYARAPIKIGFLFSALWR